MFARRAATGVIGTSTRLFQYPARNFHVSARAFVSVGDNIPDVELVEGSPGNKVSIAKELKANGLIIGVPAAFSTMTLKNSQSYHPADNRRSIMFGETHTRLYELSKIKRSR